jgi:hypothetical protein
VSKPTLGIGIISRYTETNNGYIQLYLENHKVVEEHRYVMVQHLGYELTSDEVVHHKDENKHNNAIENLQVKTRSEHLAEHRAETRVMITVTCNWCSNTHEMRPSTYTWKIKIGQTDFYCCRSHQVHGQQRKLREARNSSF